MDNIYVVKETTATVKNNLLVLFLTYLGSTSLETKTKLEK